MHDLHAGIQVKRCGGYIERVRGLDSAVYMETSVVSINIHGISDAFFFKDVLVLCEL